MYREQYGDGHYFSQQTSHVNNLLEIFQQQEGKISFKNLGVN